MKKVVDGVRYRKAKVIQFDLLKMQVFDELCNRRVREVTEEEGLETGKLKLEIEALENEIRLQNFHLSSIDPHHFYSTAELQEVLKGRVKIEGLRKYGLNGFAAGYWGENVIYALNRFCGMMDTSVVHCAGKEQDDGEFFDNWKLPHHGSQECLPVCGNGTSDGPVVLSSKDRNHELESESAKLKKPTKKR